MTTYYMTPIATILQYFTDAGVVLNGGKINTYLAGTSTPQATYTSNTGGTPNANPIILNSAGRLNNVSIWQPQGVKLKIIITDANNNQIGSPIDQVAGIDDPTDLLATLASNSVGSGADLIANAMRSFDLVSSVRAAGAPTLVAGQTRVIDIQAGTVPDDGFGGIFYWSASSTATDDGVTVIKPTGVSGAGRYLRQAATYTGSFTGTFVGCTTAQTISFGYSVSNGTVTLYTIGGSHSSNTTATSNSTSFSITGIPTAICPTGLIMAVPTVDLIDNGVSSIGGFATLIGSGPSIGFGVGINNSANGFTAAGNKGIGKNFKIMYSIV